MGVILSEIASSLASFVPRNDTVSCGGWIGIDDAKQTWRQFLSAAGVPTIYVTDSEIQPRRGVVFLKILKGLAEKDDRSRKNSSPRLLMEHLNSKAETGPAGKKEHDD